MWEYLAHLPPALSFTLLTLLIIAVIVIALKGHLALKWGRAIIGLGEKEEQKQEGIPEASEGAQKGTKTATTIVTPPKIKRSCGDCILILMGEREKFEFNMRKRLDKLLKAQMNFVEQKMIEMEGMLISSYTVLFNSAQNHAQFTGDGSNIEYKMFYGLIRDVLMTVKNEVRKSLKENGFYEITDTEFSVYVKDRVQVIITIMSQQLRNLYPSQGTVVTIEEIITNIEKKQPQLQSFVFDVYINAKQAVAETDQEIETLKNSFAQWVDEFVG